MTIHAQAGTPPLASELARAAGSCLGDDAVAEALGVGAEDELGVEDVGVADADRSRVKVVLSETGCPSSLTTRYATEYVPDVSPLSRGWVTVEPSTFARPDTTEPPDGPVTATVAKLVDTGSSKVRTTSVGAVDSWAPSAGEIDFRAACACAPVAVRTGRSIPSSAASTTAASGLRALPDVTRRATTDSTQGTRLDVRGMPAIFAHATTGMARGPRSAPGASRPWGE